LSLASLLILSIGWISGFLMLREWPLCSRDAEPAGPRARRISLIIPARNEEHNLSILLESLSRQSGTAHEILVVDDHSEDETGAVARRFGATVIESAPLPPGWTGKNWALHQGVQKARGEVYFFLDADAFFQVPDGYRNIVHTFSRIGGAVSVLPYHLPQGWIEQLSAFFNLVMAAATRGGFWGKADQGLVGPSLIIARGDYERLGGHGSVKGEVLENLALGQKARQAGISCQTFNGRDALYYRMYPGGLGDLFRGWSKAYFQGMARIPAKVLLLIVFWLVGLAHAARLLVFCLFAGATDPGLYAAVYALFAGQTFFLFNEVGRFRALTALFYPIAFVYFLLIFIIFIAMKILGIKPGWKGRTVPGSTPGKK
jgi:4,4'-diaponeurosporenoate glycosyltransferase